MTLQQAMAEAIRSYTDTAAWDDDVHTAANEIAEVCAEVAREWFSRWQREQDDEMRMTAERLRREWAERLGQL